MDEDPDFYIRTIAATWGHLDLIADWLPHHCHEPEVVAQNVLVPAAMYGQLEVLKMALKYGDAKIVDQSTTYPGWSLLHFAVEGAQRIVPTSNGSCPEEVHSPSLNSKTTPATVQQIYATQLDIIYLLVVRGDANPLAVDARGHSASYMACNCLEKKFLEGALLLDILSVEAVGGDRRNISPPLQTPGLASISKTGGWKESLQMLIEWAYSRRHYEILRFCHAHKYVSLYSDKLEMKSNPNSLRESRRPLAMAAAYDEDFRLIEMIMNLPDIKPNFFHRIYEYSHGQAVVKESILSHACQRQSEGYHMAISQLFALDSAHKFLTSINLSGMGLRSLPLELMHPNLTSLNVSENRISDYPLLDSSNPTCLGWNCPSLEALNFSGNHLAYIHPDIFIRHPKLARLTMGGNEIRMVPPDVWTAQNLCKLDLAGNMIQEFPCPQRIVRAPGMDLKLFGRTIPRRRRANYSLDGETCLLGLRKASINYMLRSHQETPKFVLDMLDLSDNHLTRVPEGLCCLAPELKNLRLAKNRITSMGMVSDYPSHLQSLDLSNNGLTRGVDPPPINAGSRLACYQSQLDPERRDACSHADHAYFPALKYLDLCNNRIEDFPVEYENPEESMCGLTDTLSNFQLAESSKMRTPVVLLFPLLHTLRISSNSLAQFPPNIHNLSLLRELVVSDNPKITRIPPLLHKLNSLFLFKFNGISDPDVGSLEKMTTSTQVLYHLKARDMNCVINDSMRLFIIGHHGKGKTTLLRHLKNSSTPSSSNLLYSLMDPFKRTGSDATTVHAAQAEPVATHGIDCSLWKCSNQCTKQQQQQHAAINFYTWDFAGEEEYYTSHQCFLTNRALYLLVWNVLDGEAGIENLGVWLQNLQARSEGHSHFVIVVATHMDHISKHDRDIYTSKFQQRFQRVYNHRQTVRGFPSIVSIQFVGCPPPKAKAKSYNIDTLIEVIYKTACGMDSIRDLSERPLRVKMLEEKIPESYETLRRFIESSKREPCIRKSEFRARVKHIIKEEEELEAAVEYLATTTGVILHFNTPVIKDYYIVRPKLWYDLCCFIIAPENVNRLIHEGRPGDEKFGLLSTTKISGEFDRRGFGEDICKLVRTFLNQFNITHQVNRDYCLVPSAISSEPVLGGREIIGEFPRKSLYLHEGGMSYSVDSGFPDNLPSIDALACSVQPSKKIEVRRTELVFRRMFFLPPIPSGFWSKLIALFLQKQDIQQIITQAFPPDQAPPTPTGPAHRLVALIGNLEMRWMYWKAGIVLYLGETIVMELHSLIKDEFEKLSTHCPDVSLIESFVARSEKLRKFRYQVADGWKPIPPRLSNVVEIVIPEFFLVGGPPHAPIPDDAPPVSSQILVKALEIIDEVLKSHGCEQFATSGIYTQGEMLHVIPCPLEYGDRDSRPVDVEQHVTYGLGSMLGSISSVDEDNVLYAQTSLRRYDASGDVGGAGRGGEEKEADKGPAPPDGSIVVFTIEHLIQNTLTADDACCPRCGGLNLSSLAPDLVFADILDFKLDKQFLDRPVDMGSNSDAVASGAFGTVFKRTFSTHDENQLEVAVKVFDQSEMGFMSLGHQEVTRSYSDMRYELNKLCTLSHAYIVRFVGLFTNPHCFVLEWAPLQSLEHLRARQKQAKIGMCFFSILKILCQVSGALMYLHQDVGIVHRDLKSSNILVFQFPEVDHCCFQGGRLQDCPVLVKITDMGICANPLGRKAGSLAGLRLMAPECLAGESNKLTEKVDIFTLGSCLYEVMTLNYLPPDKMSQPEYKSMLASGRRPQITPKDFVYPPVLTQILEECWQQDHFMRPSARTISEIASSVLLSSTSSLPPSPRRATPSSEEVGRASLSIFLDSFVLHPLNRVTGCHASNLDGAGFEACMGLSNQDVDVGSLSSTIVVGVAYNKDSVKSELEIDPFQNVRNVLVASVQLTSESDIVVGFSNGTVTLYDVKGKKMPMNGDCSRAEDHGELLKAHYSCKATLMVVVYKTGMVHLRKCTQSVSSSLTWRTSCISLRNTRAGAVCDVDCLYLPGERQDRDQGVGSQQEKEVEERSEGDDLCPRLELWFGLECEVVEVWSLLLDRVMMVDTLSQIRTVSSVNVSSGGAVGSASEDECEVCLVRGSHDASMVGAVLQTPSGGGVSIGLVDVRTKRCLQTVRFQASVCALLLTPSSLVLGTYDGNIFVYNTNSLLSPPRDVPVEPRVLHAHKNRIYYLHYAPCTLSADGHTSLFPTYIGRSADLTEKELIMSVGSGRCFPTGQSKHFKKLEHQRGCFMNFWLM